MMMCGDRVIEKCKTDRNFECYLLGLGLGFGFGCYGFGIRVRVWV